MSQREGSDDALSLNETLVNGAEEPSSESPPASRQLIKKQLCPNCKEVKLSIDRFIIRSSSAEAARRYVSTNFPLQSSTNTYSLGTLRDIRHRAYSGCPFCNLVNNSVLNSTTHAGPDQRLDYPADFLDTMCVANWEIDGRDVLNTRQSGAGSERSSVRGRTRRIHLRWQGGRIKDSYLVFMPNERYSMTTSDAQRVWGKESLFLGRKVNILGDNQALVKSWLDLCWQKHRGPCKLNNQASASKFLEMISHSYFGVVDVINMQLVELPFATISEAETRDRGYYREMPSSGDSSSSDSENSWYGRRSPPLRTHPRVSSFDRPSGRYGKSPMVGVTHAPFVALSYVWEFPASFKCIKKNVPLLRTHGGVEKVLPELPQAIRDALDLVRKLGLQYIWIDRLCIVQDSLQSWKLNAFNMNLIYGNATLTICAADGDARVGLKAMSKEHSHVQVKETISPGVTLMVTRPPEIYIKESTWNTRAWTFQERLLSRRCLIFTEGRVYFQCQSTGMSEDIFADREGAGWSLDFVDAPLQLFRQLSQRAFFVYMKLLERYSSREMTKPKDILAAYSGISNLMESTMRSNFVYGLPSSHFDIALLWEPLTMGKRRNGATDEEIEEMGSFPSWSWSGWRATTMAYRDEMIGGCLDNLEEWLQKYTWIKWFVRDGRGDLRPLWDANLSKVDKSTETRWRGYKAGHGSGRRTGMHHRSSAVRERETRHSRDHADWSGYRGHESPYVVVMDDDIDTRHHDIRNYRSETRRREEPSVYIERDRDDRVYRDQEREYVREYVRDRPAPPPPPGALRTREPPRRGDGYLNYSPPSPVIIEERRTRFAPSMNQHSHHVPKDPFPPQSQGPSRHRQSYISTASRGSYVRGAAPRSLSPPSPVTAHHTSEFFDMAFSHDQEVRPEDIDAEPKFHITMRDYPYRVVVAPFDSKAVSLEFPLLPILQFWTWHTSLYVRRMESVEMGGTAAGAGAGAGNGTGVGAGNTSSLNTEGKERAAKEEKEKKDEGEKSVVGEGLVRCHIADDIGDWCGSIIVDATWAAQQTSAKQEFIALSIAKSFTTEECATWSYYIPKEREASEWDLYYVMLVERIEEKWERRGVGKCFREAWRGSAWREIMLG